MNEKEICNDLPYTEITDINVLFDGLQSVIESNDSIQKNEYVFNETNEGNTKFIENTFVLPIEDMEGIFDINREICLEIRQELINNFKITGIECIKTNERFRGLEVGRIYSIAVENIEDLKDGQISIINSLNNKLNYSPYYFSYSILKNVVTKNTLKYLAQLYELIYGENTLCCLCNKNPTWTDIKTNKSNYGVCIACYSKYHIGQCNICSETNILKDYHKAYGGGTCYRCGPKIVNDTICKICKKPYNRTNDIDRVCNNCWERKEDKTSNILNKLSSYNSLRQRYEYMWFIEYLKQAQNTKTLKDRTFGIEFEINSKSTDFYSSIKEFIKDANNTKIYGFKASDFLIAKRDGSLGDKGIEFNTCVLAGKEGIEILKELVKIFNKHFDVDFRCGLHLHLGVNDFSDENFKCAYYFYQRFQEHFKYYVRNERLHNRYCGLLQKRAKQDIKLRSPERLTNTRYKAVNFKSVEELGTLEFRILEGTLEIDKILLWLELHIKILNYIKYNPNLIDKTTSIYRLLKKMLGKDMFDDFLERKRYWECIEKLSN